VGLTSSSRAILLLLNSDSYFRADSDEDLLIGVMIVLF
jgi:hypothetical protein